MSLKSLKTILILLFSQTALFSQDIHGTINIAVICTDGIVITADSRGGIVGSDNNAIAYLDSVCKITLLNGFPIMISGSALIKNTFVVSIINDFDKNYDKSNDIQKTLIDFREYMLKQTPDTLHQKFVCSGYYNNVPYIFEFTNTTHSANNNGFIFNEPRLAAYLTPYSKSLLPCDTLIKVLPEIIYRYAKESNSESFIGGPIAIAKITPGNIVTWIQNDFRLKQPNDYNSFLRLVKEGVIKLVPVVKNGVKLAIKAIEQRTKLRYNCQK